jgi:hypothetical protein
MFWEENWLGNFNLCSELEDLYRIAADCNITVADKSINRGTRLRWNWQWVRQLNDSEMIRKSELEGLLSTIVLQEGAADEFCWVQDEEQDFSVRGCYKFLRNLQVRDDFEDDLLTAVQQLWSTSVLLKVLLFGWRLLHDRMPTRVELWRKGVLNDVQQQTCVFCCHEFESSSHLFAVCAKTKMIWDKIFMWLNWKATDWYDHVLENFLQFNTFCRGKKVSHIIWLAAAWCIWLECNDIIFRGKILNISEVVDRIKRLSWSWYICREGEYCVLRKMILSPSHNSRPI